MMMIMMMMMTTTTTTTTTTMMMMMMMMMMMIMMMPTDYHCFVFSSHTTIPSCRVNATRVGRPTASLNHFSRGFLV
jgi:hypothetical protein